MGRDNRGGRPGGGRADRHSNGQNFGNRSFSGGGDFTSRQRFQAVCDACGNSCEVPFRPSGNKPVYCDNCFAKNKSRDTRRGDQSPDAGRGSGAVRYADSGQHKEDFKAINAKLDKILEILKPAPVLDLDFGAAEMLVSPEPSPKDKAKKSKKTEQKTTKKAGKKK